MEAAAYTRQGRHTRAMAPALVAVLALVSLLAAPLAALGPPGAPLAGRAVGAAAARAPAGARRRPQVHAAEAEESVGAEVLAPETALGDERLLGTWRYSGGSYRIVSEGERVLFREAGLAGELRPDGEWLVAELAPVGTIRLKLATEGAELMSNFKTTEGGQWGETVTAIREWSSLGAKAGNLAQTLNELKFEATAADGGVEVIVDGRQRPIGLRIAPEVATSKDLGRLVEEAHAKATEESLDVMTEMLRQVYASHFGGLASLPPKASA